jgi:hypothetical protein
MKTTSDGVSPDEGVEDAPDKTEGIQQNAKIRPGSSRIELASQGADLSMGR